LRSRPRGYRCADPEVMRYIGSGSPLTQERSEGQISRFVRHWGEYGFGLWAVEERVSGVLVGFVGLAHQDEWSEGEHRTEAGWRLDCACWGRGLATEGAVASLRYGLEEVAGAHHKHHPAREPGLAPGGGEGWPDLPWRDPLERRKRGLVRRGSPGLES
jgi:RimJ/RimL family protein N-acetyltransferase